MFLIQLLLHVFGQGVLVSPYTSQRLGENVQSFIHSLILHREMVNLAEVVSLIACTF